MRAFVLVLDPDTEEGGYTVTVPVLPGCITEGDTFDEAVGMGREALAGYLESMTMAGEEIPRDSLAEEMARSEAKAEHFVQQRQPCAEPGCADCAALELVVVQV